MRQLEAFFAAGLDHLGFGLDAASERVFQTTKGGRWDRMWEMMADAARIFPGRIAAHLIVGLGETEREVLETTQALHFLGILVALFAFTPVAGTPLANCPQPPVDAYRRVQAARWLIVQDLISLEHIGFDRDGRIRHLGHDDWRELLASGDAFRTSGCPDCNRPYYNERPSGPMYNYPWHPSREEALAALSECQLDGSPPGGRTVVALPNRDQPGSSQG
jgi:biotin synthase